MAHELALTKANRLELARAFRANKRVDFSIECVIEGQMGRAFVDDPAHPQAYCLRVGPFFYFAGDPGSAGGRQFVEELPAFHILMPSPSAWVEAAQEIFADDLKTFPRYSLSASQLSAENLARLLEDSPFRDRVVPIDLEVASRAEELSGGFLNLSDFDSAEDFVRRGFGYAVLDQGKMIGVAYSSLVCSQGIEVSVFVEDAYHRQGMATALSARLLQDCLAKHLRPNWDAANPESIRLAEKLGYLFQETYQAYYHTKKQPAA